MISDEPMTRGPAAALIVTDAELVTLLELASGGPGDGRDLLGPQAAEWVVDGGVVGILADGLAALAAPVCELELRRGNRLARGGLDEQCATLIVPGPDAGTHRLVVVTTPFLPDVLCRLNDVAPRPRAQPAVVLRYDAGDLARILASRDAVLAAELAGEDGATAAAQLVSTLREHWRVEVRWAPTGSSSGRRAVEVLDSDHGLWRVVSDGEAVELEPTTPRAVFRQFIGLLPDHGELALAPLGAG